MWLAYLKASVMGVVFALWLQRDILARYFFVPH
jgi:hypothetical protein